MKKDMIKKIISGAITGLCSGVFGAGGGNIAVFTGEHLQKQDEKTAHASAISIILPISAVGVIPYIADGMKYDKLIYVMPAFIIGSIAGAKLLGKIPVKVLSFIFAGLMAASGVLCLFN